MQKLKSFDQFATEAKISQTRKLEEEKVTKRTNEAETFKALLAEFKVTSIKELTKEQRSEFFNKLRGAELNESLTLIEEGTRGQFGKIDKKGNIVSVYTHYDSYPENMLPLIKKGYKDGKNVDDVIAKGDNSGLEASVDKMNFYGDKNATTPSKGSIANISKYLRDVANSGGAEFVYLWDEANKQWLMADIYGNGYDELVPAFESLSVSVNEAIQVQYKRDAKKVFTVYNNLFSKTLTDLGAMSNESILGCIKYLCFEALGDANFHRETSVVNNIKGSINTFEVKMPGLGNHFIKIGATTVKRVLDKYYSNIANAAGWSGIGIVEGTALYLAHIGQEAAGQAMLNEFNNMFNESVVEKSEVLCEATVEMDAMDPDNKDFLKFLKKHKVEIIDKKMEGPGGGHPVITMQGKRKDLEAVLADEELGWADAGLAKYIEESVVNEAEVNSDEEFNEYATTVLQKAFGEEYDEAKAKQVIDGILAKAKGDYGVAVGMLTSSLG